MIAKKPKHLVVDLSRVTYMDSSGLAVLIEGMQKVQEYGGKFALAGPQESVQHIFEIARLDQVFQIFPNVDSALAVKDRKSTRLNSSHRCISYAVFCLKKKKKY